MNIDFDWQNVLGKIWSVMQVIFWATLLAFMVSLIVGFVFFLGVIAIDSLGLTQYGIVTPDRRTYQQKQMDAYQIFESECLSREYSKEQCLVIWSKDDD